MVQKVNQFNAQGINLQWFVGEELEMNNWNLAGGTKYRVTTHRSGTPGTMEQRKEKSENEKGKKEADQRNRGSKQEKRKDKIRSVWRRVMQMRFGVKLIRKAQD